MEVNVEFRPLEDALLDEPTSDLFHSWKPQTNRLQALEGGVLNNEVQTRVGIYNLLNTSSLSGTISSDPAQKGISHLVLLVKSANHIFIK